MPKITKICRVCGKPYTACSTSDWGVFRWQDVACGLDCAQEYFRRVDESRKQNKESEKAKGDS